MMPKFKGKLSLHWALGLTTVLLLAEVACGTDLGFALIMAGYFLAFAFAVNRLGGLLTVNGLAIASLSTRTVLISQVFKIGLGQPADHYLDAPYITAGVMLLGMALIAVTAHLVSQVKWQQKKAFPPILDVHALKRIAIASLLLGAGSSFLTRLFGDEAGTLDQAERGVVGYLSVCMPLSVIAATAAQIIETNKKRSLGFLGALCGGSLIFLGAVSGSKEGMLWPVLSYFLTCVSFGYPLGKRHFLSVFFVAALMPLLIYPLSASRMFLGQANSLWERISLTKDFLASNFRSMEDVQEFYETIKRQDKSYDRYSYYGDYKGIIERFSLMKMADVLISTVNERGPVGFDTFWDKVAILPRSVTGSRLSGQSGNTLAHYAGVINEEDDVTGISFTIFGESYAYNEWAGVFALCTILFFGFFLTNQAFFPELRSNIWAIWMVAAVQHPIAETSPAWIVFYIFRVLPFCYLLKVFFSFIGSLDLKTGQKGVVTTASA